MSWVYHWVCSVIRCAECATGCAVRVTGFAGCAVSLGLLGVPLGVQCDTGCTVCATRCATGHAVYVTKHAVCH